MIRFYVSVINGKRVTSGSTTLCCTPSLRSFHQTPSTSTGPLGNQKAGRQSYPRQCSSGSWWCFLQTSKACRVWTSILCVSFFVDVWGAVPLLSSTLSSRPMLWRCLGVETDRASTSPMASWNPGLAPSRKAMGWSLYCRKYWMWPISWCTVMRSSMVTTVHCLILEMVRGWEKLTVRFKR